jgi:hypothetical protein
MYRNENNGNYWWTLQLSSMRECIYLATEFIHNFLGCLNVCLHLFTAVELATTTISRTHAAGRMSEREVRKTDKTGMATLHTGAGNHLHIGMDRPVDLLGGCP